MSRTRKGTPSETEEKIKEIIKQGEEVNVLLKHIFVCVCTCLWSINRLRVYRTQRFPEMTVPSCSHGNLALLSLLRQLTYN